MGRVRGSNQLRIESEEISYDDRPDHRQPAQRGAD
jgi:hypothetical protein